MIADVLGQLVFKKKTSKLASEGDKSLGWLGFLLKKIVKLPENTRINEIIE